MKKIAVFFIMFCFCAGFALAQEQKLTIEQLEAKIKECSGTIQQNKLKQNKLIWEHFLEKSLRQQTSIAIFGYRGFSPELLFDTVPHITALRREFLEANEALISILKKDPDYKHAWEAVRKAVTKEERTKADADLQQNSLRLRAAMGEGLQEAITKRQASLLAQNYAVAKYLLEHYHSRGEILPETPVIPNGYQTNNMLPEIDEIQAENRYLTILLSSLRRELYEQKYGKINY